jgi:tetratricopeptide (TPR) repeat protein
LEQGDVAGAIAAYDAFFAIADRLARADPGNVIFQRNLLVLHQRTGNLRMEQGDVSGALAAYVAGLVIAERLAKNDPNNSLSLHDLSLAHGKIGNTRAKQGDIAGAVAAYQAGLVIAERLAKADPDNGQWQGFLSAFYFKLAEVGGDPRANYRKALSVLESMARRGMRTPSDDLSPDLLRSKLEALDTLEAAE